MVKSTFNVANMPYTIPCDWFHNTRLVVQVWQNKFVDLLSFHHSLVSSDTINEAINSITLLGCSSAISYSWTHDKFVHSLQPYKLVQYERNKWIFTSEDSLPKKQRTLFTRPIKLLCRFMISGLSSRSLVTTFPRAGLSPNRAWCCSEEIAYPSPPLSLPFSLPPFPSPFPFAFPSPPYPPPPLEVGPLNAARGSGECCELPQWGLGRSRSRNRIWCISALKYDI